MRNRSNTPERRQTTAALENVTRSCRGNEAADSRFSFSILNLNATQPPRYPGSYALRPLSTHSPFSIFLRDLRDEQ